ncbi:SDR family NAD(P)-dependent oxidoreductase [Roseomonas stagni]|uniref:SDR family NAD(P)-dependent oxidoreductase n=1 Tax=Falsiroseomonas algicola TaxID=2716930 RepID=A0A6M1LIS2_9PROT|nr:SDR family NAD(P)-dependent oxidoreductase [Falsiroseomonas algicola]NGM19909.1 SDR family NAD(P)-dependent oxidoreductase [Falsiroseomonas algicola]
MSTDRQVKEQAVRLLQRMQEKLDAAEARFRAPIAIIGMGCRFPGAEDPDAFWTMLAEGRDAVRPVPPDRWAAPAEGGTAQGGFLDGIDLFDATFFGIAPREAAAMDPQQRLVLEAAWRALEDAGVSPDRLEGTATGVYLGCCTADYARIGDPAAMSEEGYAATGGAPGVAAGRLAYLLGLQGPALVVDTACSSSLVATHLAVQALRAGECSLALVGGVNLTLLPWGAATLDRLHMLSPDGRCRAFDDGANGFVRAEGCGVLVLKRLDDALADGDRVLAVIRGSAVNQDGRSSGLTAPNGLAQEAVIRAALANAGLAPADIDAIEAHGTGTTLGDPIEMQALRDVFGAARETPLRVGSVKTNIGHAEGAAGVAGLVKAALMLRHQAVVPSLHFTRLNPHIDLGGAAIEVPVATAPAALRRVGVSSFGFSGTNAHLILEAPPEVPAREIEAAESPRLLLSARTPAALRAMAAATLTKLREGAFSFADACHTAAVARPRLPWWILADSVEALATAEPSDAPIPDLPAPPGRRVDLPGHPFDRQRFWLDEVELLPGRRLTQAGQAPVFEALLMPGARLLADHRVRGTALLPAADMLERLRASAEASGQGGALTDITLDRPLPVTVPRRVQVVAGEELALFAEQDAGWDRHATARAAAAAAAALPDQPLAPLRAACAEALDAGAFHAWLAEAGIEFGPHYCCIEALWRGRGQALAKLGPAPFPVLLDAALRTAGAIAMGSGGAARLPAGAARYARAPRAPGATCWAHAAITGDARGVTTADIRLLDEDGTVLAAVEGLRLAAAPEAWRGWCHAINWVRRTHPLGEFTALCQGLDDHAHREALEGAATLHARAAIAALTAEEVAPRHRRLFAHLGRLAARPLPADAPRPAPTPEAVLLDRCGTALPDVLRGIADPLKLLFEGDGVAAIYRDSPAYAAANHAMAAAADAAAPPTGRLRVLEIGAGTGATAAAILARLDPARIDYWFTDIGRSLVERARGTIPAQHFAVLDIEADPIAQGMPEAGFDLVIAANVLHATRDLEVALRHVATLLATNGRLLLLETNPQSPAGGSTPGGWVDLVFGLTEGWWRFADTALRPDHPLLTTPAWLALLERLGFQALASMGLPGNTLLIARHAAPELIFTDPGGPAEARCAALLSAVQSLKPDQRRITLRTRGAQGPAPTDPDGAALWGMLRTLRLERPELDIRLVDGEGDACLDVELAEPDIVMRDGEVLVPRLGPASDGPPAAIDPDGPILVTGAFGGLGRFAAQWLVRRGARNLVLTGRRIPDDLGWLEALRDAGATVVLEACDLADAAARAALIARLPRLRGIVHAAGTLADATLAQATPADFAKTLAPKFEAARDLDAAFPDLDFFLLFSSAVSLFGQAGQAAHVAASAGLDALAAARRARGGRATSLGWGLWRDIGSQSGNAALIDRLAAQGLGTIPTEAGEALLDWALATPEASSAILPIDRPRFLASFAATRPPASLRGWALAKPVAAAAVTTPQAAPTAALADLIAAEASAVLGVPPGQALDRRANLFELGLDSLMAVELRNRLQSRLGRGALSATLLFDHSSVAALAAHLGDAPAPVTAPARATASEEPIAIIGMGCRFPAGGEDPDAFWQALAEGRDGITDRPEGRSLGPQDLAGPPAGYLPDVAGFDPLAFGIAPREAPFMDPQHRLLLEVAWEALEDALIPADSLAGSSTGVFIGLCNYDYAQLAASAEGAEAFAGTGGAPSIAAGRIAYLLGLNGPALVLDTACSSSLVALHLAVQAIRRGECGMALAGGTNLALGSGTTSALQGLSMLAPDARCKAFDARADGFVRADGCGIVVLKRLSDAEAAGDRILAVIRGTAVNQDGRSSGLTAPSGAAQEAVIRAALADAGLVPGDIDAIEAHGTGTALGDPIEMHALRNVFGPGRDRPLLVGSVKTNIGHAEAAAGIAGLIKAVQMLRQGEVAPSLHFGTLNPHIDLGGVDLRVPVARAPVAFRHIGVSSFGFSGTNAHAVLEAPPAPPPAPPPPAAPRLLVTARSEAGLKRLIAAYQARLDAGADFAALAASAATGRARHPWWVLAETPEALATAVPSNAPHPELPPQSGARIALPLTPWDRQRHWAKPLRAALPPSAHPLLGRRLRSRRGERLFEADLAPDRPAWLADHALAGRVVLPAAAMVEMLLAALPPEAAAVLEDVTFDRLLAPAETPVVQTSLEDGALTLSAAAEDPDAAFETVSTARAGQPGAALAPPLSEARARCTRAIDIAALYDRFAEAGLAYGPAFRGLRALWAGDGEAVAELAEGKPGFRIDPCVLDAAWQALAAALPPDSRDALVPQGLKRFTLLGGTPRHAALRLSAPDRAEIVLYDAAGAPVALCEGLALAVARPGTVVQETVWEALPPGTETPLWIDLRAEADAVAAAWRVLEAARAAPARLAVLATLEAGPAQAALAGLVPTLALEHPELRPVLLDLPAGATPPAIPAESPPVLAFRDGTLTARSLATRPTPPPSPAPFFLARGADASLEALRWDRAARPAPGPGEVEIEIAATGINFRDVMNLLGVYPGDGGAPGVECAGLVTAIGSGVAGLAPGDAVLAIAPGCFASHVVADARLVRPLPEGLGFAEAAAQPVAWLTARLALLEVARLQRGQRVLIHAATGGVGLAAVAVARAVGATVVATAGSPAKRAHLAALGIAEIHDSRGTDFAAAAPVDVVLNSLTGPAIPAGLGLLKPGGVFLEIGKAEIWDNDRVEAVRPDIRYRPVALDGLILSNPARVGEMLEALCDDLAAGLAPLPVERWPFAEVTPALRRIQAARHIGKLALARSLFRGDATYLLTGGTGALGQHLARWLVARGARHLVLLARNPGEVAIEGAEIRVVAADIADPVALRRALAGLKHPLRGIFHLAGALHDATAARLDRDRLAAAFPAKLAGAEALDRIASAHPIEHFVLFGSLAALHGSAGQANYAAANAALSAIAARRRARGEPATLVQWGAWQGAGMAEGRSGLSPEAALAALDSALSAGLAEVAVSTASAAAPPPRLALQERLAAAIGSAKRDALADAVAEAIGRILGLGDTPLDRARPLAELGLDSLMAVELRNTLSAAIGRPLRASLVFDHPSAEALIAHLSAELGLGATPRAETPPPPPAEAPTDDDDAMLLLLERKLAHAGY